MEVHLSENQKSPEQRESSVDLVLLQTVGKQSTFDFRLQLNLRCSNLTLYFTQKMRVQVVLLFAAFVAVASALPLEHDSEPSFNDVDLEMSK